MTRLSPDARGRLPGTRLLAFARLWFEERTLSSVFEPLVADWQREWQSAPRQSRPLVRIRGAAAFVLTAMTLVPGIVRAPLPAPLSRRATVRVLLFCAAGVAIQIGLSYTNWRQAPIPVTVWALLIPALVTMLLPFAVVTAVDAIRCHERWPDHIERRAALKLLAIVTLWMIVGGGWVTPAMNQGWRNAVESANAGQPVRPLTGVRELSTYQLLTIGDHVHPMTAIVRPGDRRGELANRLALVILPFLLVCLRWRLLDIGSSGWVVPLPPILIGVSAVTGALMMWLFSRALGPASPAGPLAVWSTMLLVHASSVVGQRWTERNRRV